MGILSELDILNVLKQSDRWGVNLQPEDPGFLAKHLASLPCTSVRMKAPDTCLVTFSRPLTLQEADELIDAAAQEDSPFTPNAPVLDAFLWWD